MFDFNDAKENMKKISESIKSLKMDLVAQCIQLKKKHNLEMIQPSLKLSDNGLDISISLKLQNSNETLDALDLNDQVCIKNQSEELFKELFIFTQHINEIESLFFLAVHGEKV